MIFIDNQESRSDITSLLDGMGVEYEMVPLKITDFHVTGENGLVAIEKKGPEDYVGSLISGHLSDQLTRMSQEFKLSYLLVEGSISDALAEGGITRKAYFSSLAGTYIKRADTGEKGVVCIIQVDDNWDTAMLLERIQHRMNDPKGLIRTPYIGAPQIAGGNPQLRALCAIPGIGEITARALLRKFKTLWAITRASTSEIEEVKRIGSTLANNVHEFVRAIYTEEDNL